MSSPAIIPPLPRSLGSRLKLKHLELFRNVCEKLTLRKAADASSMTQPAATKLIQELEDMLGTRLFIREKRGMKLTRSGEVLQRHVSMLLADIANMQHEISLVSSNISGRIRLGVIPSVAPELLARSIAVFLKECPRVQIDLQEAATNELLAHLAKKELDMIFGRVLALDAGRSLRLLHIYDESFAIVCRAGHPLTVLRNRSWKALAQEEWVLPTSGSPLRHLVDSLFTQKHMLRPPVVVECNSFEKMRHLIAYTDMLGILPRSAIVQDLANKRLDILKPGIGEKFAPISLIFRKDPTNPPVLEAFSKVICDTALELGLASESLRALAKSF